MRITKEENELVIRIPLTVWDTNPYDEDVREVPNLVGIIAGQEYTLSHRIDMEYKGKPPQEGMPMLLFETREELEEACREFGIDVWELPICGTCGRAGGVHALNDKGNLCHNCLRGKLKDERKCDIINP